MFSSFFKKKQVPCGLVTNHFMNQAVVKSFMVGCSGEIINVNDFKSLNKKKLVVSYGILRGVSEALKYLNNFLYIDHGYFRGSQRSFNRQGTIIHDLDGYFRIVWKDYYYTKLGNFGSSRFEKLNLYINDQRKSGDYIILSEPSANTVEFLNLKDWTNQTILELKKYTDRKIIIHNKQSDTKLKELLKNAWAFVSPQSMGGFEAALSGVPAHFTHGDLTSINSLRNIESGEIKAQDFYNLAYSQWTLDEMKSGEAWDHISKNIVL